MSLVQKINDDIKAAMKAKDKETLEAVRSIKSAIMVEATKEKAGTEVDDTTVIKIIQKLLKQRKDSAQLYAEQNRPDLADEDLKQAEVMEKYLPKMLTEDEVKQEVQAVIGQVGATGPQDRGQVMGVITKKLAGKADNAIVAKMVKEGLNK
jgi:hypothetical protein